MDASEYRSELSHVLAAYTEAAASQLRLVVEAVPEAARALDIEIFPDQDGEGTFSVRAVLDGPDLYVLNRAIEQVAEIFAVRHTANGPTPAVPLLDPFDVDFAVNDIVVDCAARWVQTAWDLLGNPRLHIPVTVVGHDDFGTITPLVLSEVGSAT